MQNKASKSLMVLLSVGVFMQSNLVAEEFHLDQLDPHSSIQINADGTKVIKKEDGTTIQIKPDGSKTITKPDGTKVQINSNGTKSAKDNFSYD